MPDATLRYAQLIASLKGRDYRLTPQRMALIRMVANSNEHPNATQLFEQIKVQFPTTSLATVYKTLFLLKDMGEILEIGLRDDHHYDANRPYPHPHLICLNCNKILDADLEAPIHTLVNEIEHFFDFQILRHQLIFYGLCPDCQKSN